MQKVKGDNIKSMVHPKNRIVVMARTYYHKHLEYGKEVANNWLLIEIPEQLQYQVRRIAMAYFEIKRRRNT